MLQIHSVYARTHTHTHTHTHKAKQELTVFILVIVDEFRQGAKLTNAVRSLVFESPVPLILCASWGLHIIFNMKKPKKCHFWTRTAVPEQQGDCTWEAASNIAEYCVLSCDQSPQKQASMAEMEVSLHWMKWKADREKKEERKQPCHSKYLLQGM